jgi:hypothetical protein
MSNLPANVRETIRSLLAASPRLCELSDKAKSVGVMGDEAEELAALRKLSALISSERPLAEYPLPIIHSNGTGIRMLTEGYDDARAKLRAAHTAFDQIEFNGRDYYTHPDAGAFQSARAAREDVAAKFEEIAAYLDAHLEHLEDLRAEAEKQSAATGGTAVPRRR